MNGVREIVRQSIYDTYVISPSGGAVVTGDWDFFKVPIGQTVGSYTKTLLDTNLDTAGTLPFESAKLVGLRAFLYVRGAGTVTPTDFNQIFNHTVIELKKEDRLIMREPLAKIPAGYGAVGAVSTGTGTTGDVAVMSNGMALKSNFYDIFTEDFKKTDRLQLQVKNMVAMAGVVATTLYLRLELECEISKEVR